MASFLVVLFVLLCCTSGNPVHDNHEQTKESYFSPEKVEDFIADIGDAGKEYMETENVIRPDMKIKLRMEGAVNGHKFVIIGRGDGKPYEGTQTIDLEVIDGAPLPFAFDILTTVFEYGNRVFAQYPDDIEDYFKQSFPAGYSWERSMTYEDGGICLATNNITLSKEIDNCFDYNIRFDGVNFPPESPVLRKTTIKWEPSTEIMYVRDGVLKGDITMALLLEGGGHYRCDFKTTYKAKNPVVLPDYHFVDHRITIKKHDKDYNKVKLHEHAKARYGLQKNAK